MIYAVAIKKAARWLLRPLKNQDGYAAIPAAYYAYAAIAVSAAATAASMYSSYQSGKSQQAAADYNAKVAEQQSRQAQQVAKTKEENYRAEVDRRMAKIRADYAEAGVTTEGTPLLVMMESARQAEKDAARIRYGGDIESSALLSEAGLQRMVGKQAYQAGTIGAGVSLLSGTSRISSMSYVNSLKGTSGLTINPYTGRYE